MLLEKGADVNAQGGMYGNAFQAASCKGNAIVVRMLQEKGAIAENPVGDYATAMLAKIESRNPVGPGPG
jgi:hypothetical protein